MNLLAALSTSLGIVGRPFELQRKDSSGRGLVKFRVELVPSGLLGFLDFGFEPMRERIALLAKQAGAK